MSTTVRILDPAPPIERPGSAVRAWVALRSTGAIFAPLWVASLFFGPTATNGDWADLTWVAIGTLFYVVALVIVLPAFAFTIGRWIDKRTWRSTRKSALTFGYYGLAWGAVAVGIYGFGGNASFGLLLWVLIPGIAAAVARVLLDVRSIAWAVISWVLFVLALLPALYLALVQLFRGGFAQSG